MADSAAQTSHHSFSSWDHKLGISVATFFRSSHLDLFTSLGQESVSGTHISGDSWLGANWSQMTSVWQFYSPPSCLSNPPNRIVLACAHGCNEGAGEDCEIHDSKVQQGSNLNVQGLCKALQGSHLLTMEWPKKSHVWAQYKGWTINIIIYHCCQTVFHENWSPNKMVPGVHWKRALWPYQLVKWCLFYPGEPLSKSPIN